MAGEPPRGHAASAPGWDQPVPPPAFTLQGTSNSPSLLQAQLCSWEGPSPAPSTQPTRHCWVLYWCGMCQGGAQAQACSACLSWASEGPLFSGGLGSTVQPYSLTRLSLREEGACCRASPTEWGHTLKLQPLSPRPLLMTSSYHGITVTTTSLSSRHHRHHDIITLWYHHHHHIIVIKISPIQRYHHHNDVIISMASLSLHHGIVVPTTSLSQ